MSCKDTSAIVMKQIYLKQKQNETSTQQTIVYKCMNMPYVFIFPSIYGYVDVKVITFFK